MLYAICCKLYTIHYTLYYMFYTTYYLYVYNILYTIYYMAWGRSAARPHAGLAHNDEADAGLRGCKRCCK